MSQVTPSDSGAWAGAVPEVPRQDFNAPEDLGRCDSLEVRFPAAILPHGLLLVLDPVDGRIVAASENVQAWLGVDPDHLSGLSLDLLFEPGLPGAVSRCAKAEVEHLGCFSALRDGRAFDAFAHCASGWWLLELEPADSAMTTGDTRVGGLHVLGRIGDYVAALKSASTPQSVAEVALETIQTLTGYDTVLYLSFLPDGAFQATAEVCNGRFQRFLDKRFPRSDIPEPARRKMLTVPMVYTPDITYTPVPIRALGEACDPSRLDLGQARLRSLAQVCNRFYLNVGIQGKLVIPLVENGTQFASIICWSADPKPISYTHRLLTRTVAELAGKFVLEKTRAEDDRRLLETNQTVTEFLESLGAEADFDQALRRLPAFLLDVMDASGVAYWTDRDRVSAGAVPLQSSLAWLEDRVAQSGNCHLSHSEPDLLAAASSGQERLAGVMAIPLLQPGQYLALFRQEWETEVKWAGNPAKPVEFDVSSGEQRLTARGSFETWKQAVRGQSRPWSASDVEVLQNLRVGLTMLQARQLAQKSNQAKSRFLADVSHEIRSPLNAVHGITRMLRSSALAGQEGYLLGQLEGAVDHMLNVVNGVLDLSKIEAGKMQLEVMPFSLAEVVDKALRIVADKAREKGLTLGAELGGLPRRLLGDPTRLDQMLINYLVNAVKFTERGRVEVVAEVLEQQQDRFLVRFSVTDTGKGLTPEQLARLFAVFEQAGEHIAREHGGSGLGLVITRRLARMMGGDAGVSSVLGQGSTFWFTCWLGQAEALPEAAAAGKNRPGAPEANESAKTRLQKRAAGKRVLLVEDEEVNQMIGLAMLANAGFEAVGAASAEEALEALAEQHFDLILMDMNLPGMSGLEGTRAILSNPLHRDRVIIAMTADAFEETRQVCLEAGMRDFIGKPITAEKFYEVMLRWL